MQIRMSLLIVSFIYLMLTYIVYFSKSRIISKENSVYEKLLAITPIGLLLEIGCNITALYEINDIISNIVARLYLIFIMLWLSIFSLYIFTITIFKNINLINYKKSKLRKIIIIGIIFFCILLIFLPINFLLENNFAYLGGLGIIALLLFSFILIIIDIIIFVKYFKSMTLKEKFPMLMLLIFIVGLLIVYNIAPQVQIISSSFAFITVIMYFTIENPDKKLLEEIQISKRLADSANEEKSMLIFNMMNDIKNIASDISNSSEMILGNNNLEKNKFFARKIISSNNKLYYMANDIYNIDMIDNLNIKKLITKYNIKILLKEIIIKNENRFNEKNISFRYNIDNNIPDSLYGDSLNLKQVLNIILDNSYKYTEKGFVELTVNSILKHDIIRLIIKIEDSGIGIKTEDIDKCFNNNSNKEKNLYKAKKIINLLGGNLLITSEYKKGTIVTIILDQKINISKKNDNYNKYLDAKKILFVDDTASSIKLITKLLTKYNINIDTVNLGKIALDKIREGEKYDLIILDEEMPYLNGEKVMRKLKSIKNFNIPVILFTKNKNILFEEKYKKIGFTDYILKPIDKNDLIEKINKYTN